MATVLFVSRFKVAVSVLIEVDVILSAKNIQIDMTEMMARKENS